MLVITLSEASMHKAHEAQLRGYGGRSEPQIRYFPKIISFLGYCPIHFDTSIFGEVISKYRTENGLSQKGLGKQFDVNGTTIATWEKIQEPILKQSFYKRHILNRFISSTVKI